MLFNVDPIIVTVGAGVGLLVGLTGMGGAALMTPILVLVLGVRPVLAVGTDLIYSTITKIVGATVHVQQGTVERDLAFRLAWGSVPGALLGVGTLRLLESRLSTHGVDTVVLHLLGIMLILVSSVMLSQMALPGVWAAVKSMSWSQARILFPLAGLIVGFLVGLTSVGSGTLIVAFLSLFTRLPAARIVGTDVFHAVLLLGVAGFAHFAAGNVDLALTANLLIGSIPGVLIGSRLCVYFPERPLRATLAGMLMLTGLRLL